mmetsp:Transcript_21785/g.70449  ORF Transcript_21785/g.70449 Transcript_21785/m.70449 type:complete len:389 (+) Transcript_21785:694-1860(+)
MIDDVSLLIGGHPLLAVRHAIGVEGNVDGFQGLVVHLERQPVRVEVAEVLLGLGSGAGTQTFVVLVLPSCGVFGDKIVILPHGEEALGRAHGRPLPHLDDGCHKFLQEPVDLQQGWPPMGQHIDHEAFDMGSVEVLVCHDHDGTVAQAFRAVIFILEAQAHDLEKFLNLLILGHLLKVCSPHVQKLTLQWVDTIPLPADDAQAGHRQRLGGVPLREDQRALGRGHTAGVRGILELGDHEELPRDRRRADLLYSLRLPGLGPVEDHLHDAAAQDLGLDRLFDLAQGPELGRLRRQRLLRLRVEGRVLNQAIHEDPQMLLHVGRLDWHATWVQLVHRIGDVFDDHGQDVVDMGASFDGADGVHVAHLREAIERGAHRDLPAAVGFEIDDV